MPRVSTAALAGLMLIAGLAIAQATNQVVGARFLAAGIGWRALREVHRKPWWRIAVVLGLQVGIDAFARGGVVFP